MEEQLKRPSLPGCARSAYRVDKPKNCCLRVAKIAILLVLLNFFGGWEALGRPFAREFRYTQPDGTSVRLWGQGDEFHATFETLDGYTVLFVPEARGYYYARVSNDGATLESTGVVVGDGDPGLLGLTRHQRISPEAARALALQRFQKWDANMALSARWAELKSQSAKTGPQFYPPSFQTKGVKCGLTVLIDFEDERAIIPREEVVGFLNGDNYTGFGNNGSVKEYFAKNSNGVLTFTNVVTLYVTIPKSLHPRSYYNDPTRDSGQQGRLLIQDALNVMRLLPNFTNDFLPLFAPVTVDGANKVVSANFFVAGNDSGVWAKGIWGHYWNLGGGVGIGGKIIDKYQLSPMCEQLDLFTFSHENGHMLCGFPDIYDYGYDSFGGAGSFCAMDFGGVVSATCPGQFCAYLKAAAGWATVVDLAPGTNFQAALSAAGPDFNRFFRLRKPGLASEYFLLENRQPTGLDANLPGGGIAIWHIDQSGDKNNQSLLPNSSHLNYEVTLVQADNRWDFQHYSNWGDPEDFYQAGNSAPGYVNAFSALTSPAASWWDGSRSGLELNDFSTNAETITFNARVQPVVIRFDPADLTVFETQNAVFRFTPAISLTNIQWYKDGAPLSNSSRIIGATSNILTISTTVLTDVGAYSAVVQSFFQGETATRAARLTVLPGPPLTSMGSGKTTLLPDGVDLVHSGSAGIGGTADSCQFAGRSISGDFDVRVVLLGISMKGPNTRAGLMVRRSLAPNSAQFSLLQGILPGGPIALPCNVLARPADAGFAQDLLSFLAPARESSDYGPIGLRCWLRLKRESSRFTAYRSLNGTDWVWLKSVELNLGESPYVGMVLTAGAGSSGAAESSFREYTLLTETSPTLAAFVDDSTAREGCLDTAQVAIYSSRNGPLQVSLSVGGTAAPGKDYQPLPTEVTIPDGTNVGIVNIVPMNDVVAGWPKTVEVSLAERPGVELARPQKASVLIMDDDQRVGGLKRELYLGTGGTAVTDFTRQITNLNSLMIPGYVTSFESATNGQEYGQVLSGYLVPPETGNYVFYMASDENSELWLSTDESSTRARLIARVQGYTAFRNYLGSGNSSLPVPLQQGRYYYVKALHKQNWGSDCFSVAWQLPGGSAPTNGCSPIAGDFLAFCLPTTPAIQVTLRDGHSFMLTCNTAGARDSVLEASNNLVDWEPVCTNSLPAMLDITTSDPSSAQQPARYYRAVLRSE